MHVCTKNLSLLTIDFIINTKSQQFTMLPFIVFNCPHGFRFLILFLLIILYNKLKVSKNRVFNVTVIFVKIKA